MRKSLLLIAAAATLFGSCRKEDTHMKVPYGSLTTTTNYFTTFKGADGNTTADLADMGKRVNMLKELDEYMISFGAVPLSGAKMKDMFNNTNNPFKDTSLKNATGISMASVTAMSFAAADGEAERAIISAWFDSVAAISVHGQTLASQGVPGALDYAYLVNGKAFEYGQFAEVGLTGALLLDHMNVMLSPEKMAADNTTVVAGKNYTQLEHNWDEAYGCLTTNEYFPKKDNKGSWQENYLGDLVRQVNGLFGEPTDVYMAFLKGRAAIVNKDIATRDQQIEIIHNKIERALATVAVSFLNRAMAASNEASRYHALSQGAGMIYALRYAYSPKLSKARSEELMGMLMNKANGFWSLTTTDITNVRDQIATTYNVDRDAVVYN
ncbi:DUF4856 domain-containing protein [Nemorincola caseinilytica]|uniref:DUF4856 domain-containing protein n=1 Tax=Nemorincola caseinilytica TaxID=2054315 RepID=A0ABP8N5V7_9BACT